VKARTARCDSLRRRAPHPAHLRCATLPLQGRVKMRDLALATRSASELRARRVANWKVRFAIHHSPLAFVFPQIRRGSGTPTNAGHQPPHLAMRRAPCRARSPVGVPPRLSPKGVSHPKGSASGQASWDVVCTGVTRLRLSQSRDAPPIPVIMPGG
jgi:hypothetical protein